MTIFVDAAFRVALVGAKSTEGPFDELDPLVLRRAVGDGGLYLDEALLDEVAEQHANDSYRHGYESRDLGDRAGVAGVEHLERAAAQAGARCQSLLSAQPRLERQVNLRLGSSSRDRVRTDEASRPPRVAVAPGRLIRGHDCSLVRS